MLTDRIDDLRQELPEVFEDRPSPRGWDDDWIFIPGEAPEVLPAVRLDLIDLGQVNSEVPADLLGAPLTCRSRRRSRDASVSAGNSREKPPPDALTRRPDRVARPRARQRPDAYTGRRTAARIAWRSAGM
jgi:hypothetical protein